MPRVALTFDDGPGPSTEAILDALRDSGARATFFVIGRNIDQAPWTEPSGATGHAQALIVRALREGHVVGNHTYSHARPDRWLELAEDLARTDEIIRALRREAGVNAHAPIPVRLPYGIRLVERTIPSASGTTNAIALDPRLAVLAALGRTHVHWTSDFDDWTVPLYESSALAAKMMSHVEQNAGLGLDAVLDLHDSGTGSQWGYARHATAAAVHEFLLECRRRHVEIFTVPC